MRERLKGSLSRVGLGVLMLLAIAPTPAAAQSLRHDKTKPIEISADSLEVEQEKEVATFAGNVDAVQGDLVLSAEALKVYYQSKGSTAGLAAGTGGSISKIEASGAVILSSPEETAEGDLGIYDVPGQLITLEGSVVLTRGENVLHGERLELNLATGKSRMVGTTATVEADGTDTQNGRVKALFTPKQKSDAKPKSDTLESNTLESDALENDANGPTPSLPEARPK